MSIQVTFHSSELPDAVRSKVAAGISKRRIPARLLYESIGQASRWLNYASAWAPIHRKAEISALYQSTYLSTLDSVESGEFHYLALGCGDGFKDASFLELAASNKQQAKVTLVDVSPSLILSAAQRLNPEQTQVKVADLESNPALSELCETLSGQPLVISCFGMLPTLGHEMLLPYLASVLNPEDQLMMSVNLSPTVNDEDKAAILAQYDNPEACHWYAGALLELGLERKDFMLECRVESLEGIAGAYRIVTHGVMLRDLELHVYDAIFPMETGDRIEVFRSERWTPLALHHRLNKLGLDVALSSESEDCQEGVYLIAKRGQPPTVSLGE